MNLHTIRRTGTLLSTIGMFGLACGLLGHGVWVTVGWALAAMLVGWGFRGILDSVMFVAMLQEIQDIVTAADVEDAKAFATIEDELQRIIDEYPSSPS